VVEEVKQNGGDGCAVLIVFGLALGVVVGGVALVLA
ncbi:MAG: hypothetical protein QG570_162, partial [Patescibacteria group bacterium]|nr:hypothetical protein [Patescibacteria group bacterium]